MYLKLTTFTKPSPKCNFTYIVLLFLFRSGAPPVTLLTAGTLTDPQLPATASNVCVTDARLGGVGRVALRKQKYWLRRCMQGSMGLVVTSASCNREPTAKTTNTKCVRTMVVYLVLHVSMPRVISCESSLARQKYAMWKKKCVF